MFSHPMFGVGFGLVFWFGLVFGFCWDGEGGFFIVSLCWMGWDRMGRYIVSRENLIDIT
jgi:hypothetical protein